MMHQNCMIKICGIRDSETAAEAAKLGADFIGIIFHPASKRFVGIDQAKQIATAAKANGAEPVAVFVDANADDMLAICKTTGIKIVQLHGDISREQQMLLPHFLQRIYVCTVNTNGLLNNNPAIPNLEKSRDYFLFDSLNPGSGETFSWEQFNYQPELPWFLAGGLNSANVKGALQHLQPNAVDVSSGVENADGEKSLHLIKDFIATVRSKRQVISHA
jgi:phosphoribosylanthranilate isomerase